MIIFKLIGEILDDLYNRIPENSDQGKDELIKKYLITHAATYKNLCSSVTVNDYSSEASQFVYVYKYITSHANMVYSIVKIEETLQRLFHRDRVNISSIGGGPGTEFLGIAKYLLEKKENIFLSYSIYDRETGWLDCWRIIESKIRLHTTPFLAFVDNHPRFDLVSSASWTRSQTIISSDLISIVYFLSEVYKLSIYAGPMLEQLFKNLSRGTTILIIDNNYPSLVNWIDNITNNSPVEQINSWEGEKFLNDYNEQKTLLGKYYDKFSHEDMGCPKLTGKIAYRILRRK